MKLIHQTTAKTSTSHFIRQVIEVNQKTGEKKEEKIRKRG